MVKQEKIKVVHALDYFLIGVCFLCVLALAGIDVAQAQQACLGNTAEQCGFPQAQITQDPILVLQRLETRNRAYYAAEIAQKNSWRSYGYDVAIPIYDAGRSLPAAAAVRGEYDLELQRRSLCVGLSSQGAQGVYAGRALHCRRGVFD